MKKIVLISILFIPFLLTGQSEMILVAGGEYLQGCTDEQKPDCDGDEYPAHAVKLNSFYIGKYEVTQLDWELVMNGDQPSENVNCGGNCPVENIDWYSMLIFCNEKTLDDPDMGPDDRIYYKDEALTQAWEFADYNGEGDTPGAAVFCALDNAGYRLPTEAEWEFAARGGSLSEGYKFSGSNDPSEVGWFKENAEESIHPVGEKMPNELGIHDMTGNVWERVYDYQGDYEAEHICNPKGPGEGSNRIYRGGSFFYSQSYCRVADRYFNKPTRASSNIGFRVVKNH